MYIRIHMYAYSHIYMKTQPADFFDPHNAEIYQKRISVMTVYTYTFTYKYTQPAEFFDPYSAETYQKRINVMTEALNDAIRYLDRGTYMYI
jgi:hypothetical protein